jgi:hypothetical protein
MSTPKHSQPHGVQRGHRVSRSKYAPSPKRDIPQTEREGRALTRRRRREVQKLVEQTRRMGIRLEIEP